MNRAKGRRKNHRTKGKGNSYDVIVCWPFCLPYLMQIKAIGALLRAWSLRLGIATGNVDAIDVFFSFLEF